MREQPTERTSVTLPRDLARKLRDYARSHDDSASGVVRDALERYLTDRPEEAGIEFIGIGSSERGDTAARSREAFGEVMDENFDRLMGR